MESIIFSAASLLALYIVRNRKSKSKKQIGLSTQEINRLYTHTCIAGFISQQDARLYVNQRHYSPHVLLLNGTWSFHLFNTLDEAILFSNLKSPLPSSSSSPMMQPIQVPGNWQLQIVGDNPIYTNIKYTIPINNPPFVPERNPTGYYTRRFYVHTSWIDRRVIICFDGVDSALYLWINSKFIGLSKDSRLPAEFDITEYIYYDSHKANIIEAVVPRYSDGSFLEDQDMFNLSGIFRDVLIYSLPKVVHICDFNWNANISTENTLDCSIDVSIALQWNIDKLASFPDADHEVSRRSSLESEWMLKSCLYQEGHCVSVNETSLSKVFIFDQSTNLSVATASSFASLPASDDANQGRSITNLTLVFKNEPPQLWSAERPFIYTLVVSLINVRGDRSHVLQSESCRVGLRSIQISDGMLKINHAPIVIRGTNVHEHHPLYGHTVSDEVIEADLKLMKRNNFNAIRTSHYPHKTWLYEIATIYGLYVIDECNIETHGMKPYAGILADDSKWYRAFMLRLKRMYYRDRNHTCIIAFSLGNESGYGHTHDKMASWIRKNDASRFICYEPASFGIQHQSSSKPATDIICPMYARIRDCIHLSNKYPEYPVILCEYSHQMGNSCGNLIEYWDAFNTYPKLQGGFIWDWVDQGISIGNSQRMGNDSDDDAIVTSHPFYYGGDFGENIHDDSFCLNGLNWPHRGIDELLYTGGFSFASITCYSKFATATHNSSIGSSSHNKIDCISSTSNAKQRDVFGLTKNQHDADSLAADTIISSSSNSRCKSSVIVDTAMPKPSLLEAKQCMSRFKCSIIEMHTPLGVDTGISSNDTDGECSATSPRGTTIDIHSRFSIQNHYDHIQDISTELTFTAFLTCDGLVVSSSPLQPTSSAYIHSHLGTVTKNSLQYVECESIFEVMLHDTSTLAFKPLQSHYAASDVLHSDLHTYTLFGSIWSDTALLDAIAIDRMTKAIDLCQHQPTRDMMWTNVDLPQSTWSVVVVGTLARKNPYASMGYPVGLAQLGASKQISACLSSFLSVYENEILDSSEVLSRATITWNTTSDGGDDILISCGDVSIVIGTDTGLPVGISKNGCAILQKPTKLHLHRAATDNDRIGYAPRWKQLGMDREMRYVTTNADSSSSSSSSRSAVDVIGQVKFKHTTITRVDRGDDGSEGIQVDWTMRPTYVNKASATVIKQLQQFYSDDSETSIELSAKTNVMEEFIHHVASVLMLGRHSKYDSGSQCVVVTVFKLALYVCSTTKSCESQSIGPLLMFANAPTSAVDSIDYDDDSNDDDTYDVVCKAVYSISSNGQFTSSYSVDTSRLIMSLPRIGLQYCVMDAFKEVLFSGMGPHECYSDRKASCINSLYRSPVAALYVPYIKPCENGNRTDINFIQLCDFNGVSGNYSKDDIIYCGDKNTIDLSDDSCNYYSSASILSTTIDRPAISQVQQASPLPLDLYNASFVTGIQNITRNASSISGDCNTNIQHDNSDDYGDNGDDDDDNTFAFRITSSKCFNFSAQHFTSEDLSICRHSHVLERYPRPEIYLNIDAHHMGLGGDDSWTASVHDEHIVHPNNVYQFNVIMTFVK